MQTETISVRACESIRIVNILTLLLKIYHNGTRLLAGGIKEALALCCEI